MRILVLQESDWIERGPHQSHHLLERLSAKGHEVRVVDFQIGRRTQQGRTVIVGRSALIAPPKVVEGSKIEIVRPAAVHLPILDYVSVLVMHTHEIRKQFRVFRPDIVLGFGLLNAFVGIRAAKNRGIPFVYYLIDELHRLVPEPALQGVARLIEQANVRGAGLVLAINHALEQYAVEMGARPDRTKVLPAGIDLQHYLAGKGRSEVRIRHGIGERDLVLFFMGWVYPFSGLRQVAEHLAEGEGRQENLTLLVVGKGDSWNELRQIARTSASEDRIKMVEFRPYSEMPSYLAAADICLLPAEDVATMRNIVPIKMYEYLASGKPVIATRLPGLVREFGEGNGVLYVDRPEQVIPKAVELARQGAMPQLGARGRAFVSGNEWQKITDTFESYLKGLIEIRET